MTLDEMKELPPEEQEALYKRLHKIRKKVKPVTYSAVYGVGAPKLSRETGMPRKEAKQLLDAYWERNWAVKKVAEEQYVKTISDGSMWLKNPVSGFYHELRFDKDRFSTLNQSTGVYIFDSWVARCRAKGLRMCGQFHDEVASPVADESHTRAVMEGAVENLNHNLRLNVSVGIDVQFGKNYAEIH